MYIDLKKTIQCMSFIQTGMGRIKSSNIKFSKHSEKPLRMLNWCKKIQQIEQTP